jgi:cell wall-associated NlpC family hydrolase
MTDTRTAAEQRAAVVAEAMSWLRTPFHDCAAIKGVGVDCANFIAQVFERAGIVGHIDIAPYSPQWFLHHHEEIFLGYVLAAGATEIAEEQAQAGDVVLYQLGRCFAHGAVVVIWPAQIVHAHNLSHGVVTGTGDGGDLADRPRRFFTMWPEVR